MGKLTDKLKMFLYDKNSDKEEPFDLEKGINENFEKIDKFFDEIDTQKASKESMGIELALKIDKASISTDSAFTSVSNTQVPSTKATKEYVIAKVNELINNSPEALDTLKELSEALGNDENFATTMTNELSKKISNSSFTASGDVLIGTGSGTYNTISLDQLRDLLNVENGANKIPPGTIFIISGNTVPPGFLKANGAYLSKTIYENLYSAIGSLYGSTTSDFKLPDLRGYFPRFWDDGRGIDNGRTIGSTQSDSLIAHNHIQGYGTNSNYGSRYGSASGSGVIEDGYGATLRYTSPYTSTTGEAETRPKNIALMAIIKYI